MEVEQEEAKMRPAPLQAGTAPVVAISTQQDNGANRASAIGPG